MVMWSHHTVPESVSVWYTSEFPSIFFSISQQLVQRLRVIAFPGYLCLSSPLLPQQRKTPHRRNGMYVGTNSMWWYLHNLHTYSRAPRDAESNLNDLLSQLGPAKAEDEEEIKVARVPSGEAAVGGLVNCLLIPADKDRGRQELRGGSIQGASLQRIASRCQCDVIYVSYGGQAEPETCDTTQTMMTVNLAVVTYTHGAKTTASNLLHLFGTAICIPTSFKFKI